MEKGCNPDARERRRERDADEADAPSESTVADALHRQAFVDFGNEDLRAGSGIAGNAITLFVAVKSEFQSFRGH